MLSIKQLLESTKDLFPYFKLPVLGDREIIKSIQEDYCSLLKEIGTKIGAKGSHLDDHLEGLFTEIVESGSYDLENKISRVVSSIFVKNKKMKSFFRDDIICKQTTFGDLNCQVKFEDGKWYILFDSSLFHATLLLAICFGYSNIVNVNRKVPEKDKESTLNILPQEIKDNSKASDLFSTIMSSFQKMMPKEITEKQKLRMKDELNLRYFFLEKMAIEYRETGNFSPLYMNGNAEDANNFEILFNINTLRDEILNFIIGHELSHIFFQPYEKHTRFTKKVSETHADIQSINLNINCNTKIRQNEAFFAPVIYIAFMRLCKDSEKVEVYDNYDDRLTKIIAKIALNSGKGKSEYMRHLYQIIDRWEFLLPNKSKIERKYLLYKTIKLLTLPSFFSKN